MPAPAPAPGAATPSPAQAVTNAPPETQPPPSPPAAADAAASGPAPTQPPAQTASTGAAAAASVSPDWRAALLAWLRAHRVYPEEARRRGEEGEVDLRFAIMRDGAVTAVAVTHSSGSDRLDAAALAMLRGAHVPPFPPDMKAIETVQTARIRYRLDE